MKEEILDFQIQSNLKKRIRGRVEFVMAQTLCFTNEQKTRYSSVKKQEDVENHLPVKYRF